MQPSCNTTQIPVSPVMCTARLSPKHTYSCEMAATSKLVVEFGGLMAYRYKAVRH